MHMCVGYYEAAVESQFKANRLADTLLVANVCNAYWVFTRMGSLTWIHVRRQL